MTVAAPIGTLHWPDGQDVTQVESLFPRLDFENIIIDVSAALPENRAVFRTAWELWLIELDTGTAYKADLDAISALAPPLAQDFSNVEHKPTNE